jgi:uncharacterized protein
MSEAGARLISKWLEPLLAERPGVALFDAHTHIGANDPDGSRCTPEELLALLDPLGARAVVFAMQEPDGYADANDAVIAAAASSDGRLVPFCRLDPNDDPVAEARRCVEAGARGIKLHPRAEAFALDAPAARKIFAFADAERLPVLIHAGRGIPALGRHTLELATEFPHAVIILAHAAVSDLSWICGRLPEHPNVFIDTSWWNPVDVLTLFAYAPPGRILFASDAPYGTPAMNAVITFRCAIHAGLGPEQIELVAGRQLQALVDRADPVDAGPAPGPPATPQDLILDRIGAYLMVGLGRLIGGVPADDMVGLARLGCAVDPDAPQAEVCAVIASLIDASGAAAGREDLTVASPERIAALGSLLLAATVAATPRAPVPAEFAVV